MIDHASGCEFFNSTMNTNYAYEDIFFILDNPKLSGFGSSSGSSISWYGFICGSYDFVMNMHVDLGGFNPDPPLHFCELL